jgi:phenylacetic acid degradation operon negative regulatory protein
MAKGLVKETSKNLILSILQNKNGLKRKSAMRGRKDFEKTDEVRALQRQGYIAKSSRVHETIYRLTDKGLRAACLLQMKDAHKKLNAWDGQWRIIIFDIPEKQGLIRDLFRRFLKEGGLLQLQKSVWVTPCAIERTAECFIQQLHIEHWVRLMIVKSITNSKTLIEKFGLREC